MAFLNVKVQLNPTPDKALIQQVREGRRLAKIPCPAALAGEGFGKVRQIRRLIRRNHFRGDALAVVGEKGLFNRRADLLVRNTRQQLNQIGYAAAYRSDTFRL